MPWLTSFFLLLLALLIGWIPLLGPLALGFLAARAERGARVLLALLPALLVQGGGLLLARTVTRAARNVTVYGWHLEGGFWTAISWLVSPLGTALGRPFSRVLADTTLPVFLLIFTAPVLLGLLIGALLPGRPGFAGRARR
ncbi:hypothetical protein Q0M94_07795 [Deinococcus radiomollis]|uniref:hypothetical protein n=1 Tax=Deinococcus radiomollis TaxID=468916 RepID=UPI0038918F80